MMALAENDKLPQSPLAFWSSENSKLPSRTNASGKISTPSKADLPSVANTDDLNPFLEASDTAANPLQDKAEEQDYEAEQRDLADQEEGEADSTSEADAPFDELEVDSDIEAEAAHSEEAKDVSEHEHAEAPDFLSVGLDELKLEDSAPTDPLSAHEPDHQEPSPDVQQSLTSIEQVGKEPSSEPEASTRSQKPSSRAMSSRRRSSRLESKRLKAEDERESSRTGTPSRRSVVEVESSDSESKDEFLRLERVEADISQTPQ